MDASDSQTPAISDATARLVSQRGGIGVLVVRNGVVVESNALAVEALQITSSTLPPALAAQLPAPPYEAVYRYTPDAQLHERVILITAIDTNGATGTTTYLVADRTDVDMIETELRRRTAQLSSTIESLPFDFWMNDVADRTVIQNAVSRALWGERAGQRPSEVAPPADILELWQDSNRRALAGETVQRELHYRIAGRDHTFHNIVAPVMDGSTIIGILGSNIDITDYRNAVADRDVLLHELHHRVKNHLQMVLSMISIGRESIERDPEGWIATLEDRINAIYLVHEQLYTGHGFSHVDLRDYLDSIVSGIAIGYDHRISTQFADRLGRLRIERAIPFGMVVTELLVNAVRHGDRIAPIEIAAVREGESVRLTLTNRLAEPSAGDPGGGTSQGEGMRRSGSGLSFVTHLSEQVPATVSTRVTGEFYESRVVVADVTASPIELPGTLG